MTHAEFAQLPAGDLVLASASSTRAKILLDAGLSYRRYPVAIDEESVRASASAEAVPIGDIATILAEMKAAVAVQRLALETDPSPAFVLGCDQILACDGVIYSKPQDHANEDYADIDQITDEVRSARRLFASNGWPVIDVTRRSVEETAAAILQYYTKWIEARS